MPRSLLPPQSSPFLSTLALRRAGTRGRLWIGIGLSLGLVAPVAVTGVARRCLATTGTAVGVRREGMWD